MMRYGKGGWKCAFGGTDGGGLSLYYSTTTLTATGGVISLIDNSGVLGIGYAGYNTQGRINSNGASFEIARSSDQFNYFFYSDSIGILSFTPGSTINNFTMSSYVSPTAPDKLTL